MEELLFDRIRMKISDAQFRVSTDSMVLADFCRIRPGGRVLDLGCGWGPIALTAALDSPHSTVWAVDVNERALDLAKSHIGPMPTTGAQLPITDITNAQWKDAPAIKSRLAGGYCLRAPAQGPCSYANICEHCPSFHTTTTYLPVLTAQRDDAAALAADATTRG